MSHFLNNIAKTTKRSRAFGMCHLGSRLAMSITGFGIFSFAMSLLLTQSMFITKPVSIVIYCGVLLLFRDFREQELVAVISLARKLG